MDAVTHLSPTVGVVAACDFLGVARATFYRQRPVLGPSASPLPEAALPADRPAPARALSSDERASVLAVLHEQRFQDRSPAAKQATLLDEGQISQHFRGRPGFNFEKWKDARSGAEVCPTGAISVSDKGDARTVTIDYGLCVFCGLCAEASSDEAVRITQEFELATAERQNLVLTAEYEMNADRTHRQLLAAHRGSRNVGGNVENIGQKAREKIHKLLGRSLSIREVDAGSCNGCELEIVALNNPIYDIERFGIHFVASPRHADMLLVTGPVTRNMELALLKTYRAMPEPKVVVAVGACGISGGIFGLGGVDNVLPVDVYIQGCPPRPQALLHGILLAVGRLRERLFDEHAD